MDWFKSFNWNYQEYKFFKPMIWLFVLAIVGLGVYVLSLNNFTGNPYYYSYCPVNSNNNTFFSQCFNAYYHSNLCGSEIKNDDPLCSQEFILAGNSLGVKPPWLVVNFFIIVLALILILVLLNHLIFNKGFKFPVVNS